MSQETKGPDSSRDPSGDDSEDRLSDIVHSWWSRYCPECGERRPLSEEVCPKDGTSLRHESVWSHPSTGGTGHSAGGGTAGSTTLPPSSEGDDSPGDESGLPPILGGKWKVEKLEKKGTFGEFYSGTHTVLGMKVGIKVLRKRLISSSIGRRSFNQEAMRLSRLNHPNIVKVLDYGEEGQLPYLVMEYLSGKPLHRYLTGDGMDPEDGVEVVRQAAVALIAAHRGTDGTGPLVHLDLKPEHIFIEKIQDRWHVRVIDFGIAEIALASSPKASPEEPREKSIAGTLPYMAPERFQSKVDPRCDLYSLGIILYEIVGGRLPIEGSSYEDWEREHKTRVPEAPGRHRLDRRSSWIKDLNRLILWCLEKDPERRPQSAEELANALQEWQARPKRSFVQKALRLARTSFIVALVALGLLYWAPWEKVIVDPSKLESIAPGKSISIPAMAGGPGYEGCPAFLEVSDGNVQARFDLGTVVGGTIDGRSPTGSKILGTLGLADAPEEKGLQARIVVEGHLWRRLVSPSFSIRLDNKPPGIVTLDGKPIDGDPLPIHVSLPEKVANVGKPLTLWVVADEPVLAGECALNGMIGQLGADQKTLVFQVPWAAKPADSILILTDLAGNQEKFALRIDRDPAWKWPPQINVFSLTGLDGTAERPLHEQNCACRASHAGPGTLTFDCEVYDPYSYWLELWAGDVFLLESEELHGLCEGQCVIYEEDLWAHKSGDSVLLNLVAKSKDGSLSSDRPCTVQFEAPLNVMLWPETSRPLPGDRRNLELQIKPLGPPISGVRIAGIPAEPQNNESYVATVEVKPHGTTEVKVDVTRENGCVSSFTPKPDGAYFRNPMSCAAYGFEILPSISIEIGFLKEKSPGTPLPFWYVTGEASAKLLEACRGPGDGEASLSKVSGNEAEKVAELFTEILLREKWIEPGESGIARLPYFEEIQVLWRLGLIPAAAKGTRCYEWVAEDPSAPPTMLVEIPDDPELKLIKKRAEPDGECDFGEFRLIIPEQDERARLSPRYAQSCSRE